MKKKNQVKVPSYHQISIDEYLKEKLEAEKDECSSCTNKTCEYGNCWLSSLKSR